MTKQQQTQNNKKQKQFKSKKTCSFESIIISLIERHTQAFSGHKLNEIKIQKWELRKAAQSLVFKIQGL